jgi:hypothetical protein
MYFFKYEIYYTIWLHIILFLLNFFGYEYVNFQFSKNDKYAQRLCISIFWFYCFKIFATKNKEPKLLEPKRKLVGELNPYSTKNSTQLQHKFLAQPHPTQTHPNPQS